MNTRDELTKQEMIVLAFVAKGWRTAKIAQELSVSPRTIETHLSHIFQKLGVSSRTEAAMYALRANLTVRGETSKNSDEMPYNNSYSYGDKSGDLQFI